MIISGLINVFRAIKMVKKEFLNTQTLFNLLNVYVCTITLILTVLREILFANNATTLVITALDQILRIVVRAIKIIH